MGLGDGEEGVGDGGLVDGVGPESGVEVGLMGPGMPAEGPACVPAEALGGAMESPPTDVSPLPGPGELPGDGELPTCSTPFAVLFAGLGALCPPPVTVPQATTDTASTTAPKTVRITDTKRRRRRNALESVKILRVKPTALSPPGSQRR